MVVGSKAEEELWGMTREEVEKELLKLPGHTRFREYNTHLVSSEEEWEAVEEQLEKVETWPKDKRECCPLALIWLPCSLVLCLQLSSTLSPMCGRGPGWSSLVAEPHIAWLPFTMCVQLCSGPGLLRGVGRCCMAV
jgi:hypothetical protein